MSRNTIGKFITYFSTYEQREKAFRKRVHSLIPRKFGSPALFWRDFVDIWRKELIDFKEIQASYITANPRDCLAFGTPRQVLQAAGMVACRGGKGSTVYAMQTAHEFELQAQLDQQMQTLSGGETLKLALAKSYMAADLKRKLIIASPFSWLSQRNSVYLQRVLDYYHGAGFPVELLAMEGEDSTEPFNDQAVLETAHAEKVNFSIFFDRVQIQLGPLLPSLNSRQPVAFVDDSVSDLRSPCLFVGENGQGKSLLAKTLAGAVPFTGQVSLPENSQRKSARLLFQDVISQTLSRSFRTLADCSSSDATGLKPAALYNRLSEAYGTIVKQLGSGNTLSSPFEVKTKRSLLEIKMILAAVRLSELPGAFILDEPDWGLTRQSSIAFVVAISKVSHALDIPVILISHKPWWTSLAESTLYINKDQVMTDRDGICSFHIHMKRH